MLPLLRPLPLLLLLTLTHVICGVQRNSDSDFCMLGDKRYEVGKTWHPVLKPFGENTCVNCTCFTGGNVKCTGVDCPRPDCEEPKMVPGECCPTCDAGTEGSKEVEGKRPGCQFHGASFKDGDTFPSNRTGLRPTRQDQCVMCVCTEGRVLCHLKTCLPTKCTKFIQTPDDCCPQCAEISYNTKDYPSYVRPSDSRSGNVSEGDCSSPDGSQKNGSSWNPVVGTFGEMHCIVCTCLNGHVICNRIGCPSESSLSCKRPRQLPGACCKQCPPGGSGSGSGSGNGNGNGNGSGSGSGSGSGKKPKKKSKNDQRRQSSKCEGSITNKPHPDRKPSLTSVADILNGLCLPRHTDRLVYQRAGDNFEILAFDAVKDKSVEMLSWEVEEGKLSETKRELTRADEFRKTVTCQHIVGATNKNGFKKLMKKVESKLQRCQKSKKGCKRKDLEKIVKRDRRVKPVALRHLCGE